MPVKRLKYTFNYIKPNIPSFILFLIIISVLNLFQKSMYLFSYKKMIIPLLIITILSSIMYGYGLSITRNIINNGGSLPKLEFFKSFVLGIKSVIIIVIYGSIQMIIFWIVSKLFDFPFIEIEEGAIHISNVSSLFYSHGSIDIILFGIFVVLTFYVSTFFLEIALARLADKKSLLSALNFKSVLNCIDTIGWIHYMGDYTKLILAIIILAYLKYGVDFILVDNLIFDLIIGVLIFIVQYIGIGMIYKEYKIKKHPRPKKRYYEY